MKTPIKISLGVVAITICIGLTLLWTSFTRLPERHARSCLQTITELTDQIITQSIPEGDYIEAIDAAEYIQGYYPVGVVLPADHEFAGEYTIERTKQIERILEELRAISGADYGTDWHKWKAQFRSNTQYISPVRESYSE